MNMLEKKSFDHKFWHTCFFVCIFREHVAACTLLAIYSVELWGMRAHTNEKITERIKAGFGNQGYFCCASRCFLLVLKAKQSVTDGSAPFVGAPGSATLVAPARLHLPPPVSRPEC